MVQNKALVFTEIPSGLPEVGKHLKYETREFDLDQAPPPGGVTVKVLALSFDPFMRGRMRAPTVKSYAAPFEIGKPITNAGILRVIRSDNPDYKPDQVFRSHRTWFEEYSVLDSQALKVCHAIHNPYNLPVQQFLGALGMPGLTAYSSFYEIGRPKKGETIFVSAASGAVGQLVGQLAKHEGLKVIGSVGDDKKLDFILKDLNFDGGFNYKTENAVDALKRLAPNGIDIYYENVGGEQLDAAIGAANPFARIVACGMISQYNIPVAQRYGPRNIIEVVTKRIRMEGFIVSDPELGPKHTEDHQKNVQRWLHDGTFKAMLSVTKGMDNAAEGLLGLFAGKNFGKAVLELEAAE